MIDYIFEYVVQHGTQIKFSKSELDNDVWELNGLHVTLCDGGVTKGIIWGPRLNVYQVEDENPMFSAGTNDDLEVIYYGLNALEVDMPV